MEGLWKWRPKFLIRANKGERKCGAKPGSDFHTKNLHNFHTHHKKRSLFFFLPFSSCPERKISQLFNSRSREQYEYCFYPVRKMQGCDYRVAWEEKGRSDAFLRQNVSVVDKKKNASAG